MKDLCISIEIEGQLVRAGAITGEGPSDAVFCYASAYLQDPSSSPLSISLPLQEDAFSPAQTACFFEGLLPEGFTRRSVAQWMHVDEGDYLSILHGLGRECLGAICVTEEGEKLRASYERLTARHLRELAAEGAVKSAEIVAGSHLSLTGASGKAGLYRDVESGIWYVPKGTAPSTHIVKQSHVRLDSIVANEQLCQMTAEHLGIHVPRSFIVDMGGGGETDVLFATERYDRTFSPDAGRISGLKRPLRLHQEDFAQALGIPSQAKYEPDEGGYMQRMFELLRRASSDPVADQLQLWDRIVFNRLIGNTDAHVKNFSLLYAVDLKTVRLAPAYDIVSTAIYGQSTRNMAFGIGGKHALEEIDAAAFRTAARETGLGEALAMDRLEQLSVRFTRALKAAAEELAAQGYAKAFEIRDRIIQAGNNDLQKSLQKSHFLR